METGDGSPDSTLTGTVIYLDKFRRKCRLHLVATAAVPTETLDARIAKITASVLRINALLEELKDTNAMPMEDGE